MRFGNLDALHPFEVINSCDLGLLLASVSMYADSRIPDLDLATDYFSESNSSQVIRIIEIGDQQFETFSRMGPGRRDMLDNGVEERLHRATGVVELLFGVTTFGTMEPLFDAIIKHIPPPRAHAG